MKWLRITPEKQAALSRFRAMKRGYFSLIFIGLFTVLALLAEILASHRATIVYYQGQWFFPSYGKPIPGHVFALNYDYETNYRELQAKINERSTHDWILMPLVPYGPYESDLSSAAPSPPSIERKHYLGTDSAGRDILSRLLYGFRIGLVFAVLLALAEYAIGMMLGAIMGYYGGRIDLIGQRLLEVWDNIPVLYIVMIIAALFRSDFWMLLLIMVSFGWMARAQTMRALTLRERTKDYVDSARVLGFSSSWILAREIIPNTLPIMLSFLPFTIEASFIALTIYDFLGFGLPVPTPSWGELLKQGVTQMQTAPWILASVVTCLVTLLVSMTFIGESLRDALDPKRFARYQ